MSRQVERLDEILSKLVYTITNNETFEGAGNIDSNIKFSERYPDEWNTILRVTKLHEDNTGSDQSQA